MDRAFFFDNAMFVGHNDHNFSSGSLMPTSTGDDRPASPPPTLQEALPPARKKRKKEEPKGQNIVVESGENTQENGEEVAKRMEYQATILDCSRRVNQVLWWEEKLRGVKKVTAMYQAYKLVLDTAILEEFWDHRIKAHKCRKCKKHKDDFTQKTYLVCNDCSPADRKKRSKDKTGSICIQCESVYVAGQKWYKGPICNNCYNRNRKAKKKEKQEEEEQDEEEQDEE
ncbi:uncharacterized protein J3D65DRAFT_670108 [Phyllosticta citribraziliensis]|uniref:Uncharacterized protein n=1 Tax=Phyllosticta citribraziliensis TaxID=989973 RepID=A0ABR1LC87_9PEZI